MGICLTGFIEVARDDEGRVTIPASGDVPEHTIRFKPWYLVAKVEYNKDYPLMRVAREIGTEGMPPDPSSDVEDEGEDVKYWLEGEYFKLLAHEMLHPESEITGIQPGEEPDQPTLQHKATQAFIDSLIASGAKVRVVFTEL